ncbi:MAG TPA: hypothetical protein VK864_08810, partial [Longimicrobiales bacterium]|nr:hypothetical protein [Longimicrobiales bacterium]
TPKTVLPLTPDVVLLGGTSSRIYRTTDRGRTWNWTQLGRATDQQVVRLAPAADNALIAIVNRTDTGMGAIWRSTDGGVTWEQLVAVEKPLFDVSFRDGTQGVAVGDGIAYTSEDGGQSWKRVLIAGRKNAVEFIDGQTVLAVGSRPKVAISQNGGKTWRAVEGPWNEQVTTFNSLAIVNGGSYYVGTGGTQVMVVRYFDPKYEAPFADGTVAIPFDFSLPGGDSLAAGTYQVTLEHRGDEHIIELERKGAAPNDSTKGRGLKCADPCLGDVPVDVQYDFLNLAQAKPEALQLKFSLEPASNGLAIVADVPLRSRDLQTTAALLLAANPAQPKDVTVTAQDAKKKGGGLLDRVKKAAQGDVKGALENAPVDPAAAAQRLKESRATTGAVYRIRVRYPIDLIRRAR